MIPTRTRGRRYASLLAPLVGALVATHAVAFQQAPPKPQLYLIKDVRLVDTTDAPRVSIVLRDGRIERLLDASSTLPVGAREIDGKGMLAVPAFIDAFTQAGCEMPAANPQKDLPPSEVSDVHVDMRDANRKGIQPAFRAADVFNLPKDKSKAWRESGFGALTSAPAGQLLGGTSALCTTREAAMRDTILAPDVFAHAAFRAAGGGYPSTLIGYFAQMRQFFLDVTRHAELRARYDAGRPGPRPAFDADLEAGAKLAKRGRRVMCEADSAQDIRRWVALGDELGIDIGIVGGREAWKVADLIKARNLPLVLTLNWGEEVKDPHEKDKKAKKDAPKKDEAKPDEPPKDEPPKAEDKPAEEPKADEKQAPKDDKKDDKAEAKKWEYEEPLGVREDKRRLWEEGRNSAIELDKAGVSFAFGSESGNGADLLKKVRTLVESGLAADVALASLTARAAKLVGAEKHLGEIRAGADASLALWTANPTSKEAKLAWLFVDGFPNEFEIKEEAKAEGKPDEGVDATGTWAIEIKSDQGARPGTLELSMAPDGEVTGKLTTKAPGSDTERVVEYKGHVGGKTMVIEGSYSMRDVEITSKWKVELAGDSFSGTSTNKGPWGENEGEVSGTRKPKSNDEVIQGDDDDPR